LKDRVPGALPVLDQALTLSLATLESGSTQKLAPEGLEVAVLDRTRDGRKFRRVPVQDVRRLLGA
jgi:proteasome alpha subunit